MGFETGGIENGQVEAWYPNFTILQHAQRPPNGGLWSINSGTTSGWRLGAADPLAHGLCQGFPADIELQYSLHQAHAIVHLFGRERLADITQQTHDFGRLSD